ncbi:MAG: hypothetical protein R2744_08770 [Bacteroidales bacterium]
MAKKIVRQEWDKWNLDAFYPMNYNDFYLEETGVDRGCMQGRGNGYRQQKPLVAGCLSVPRPKQKALNGS